MSIRIVVQLGNFEFSINKIEKFYSETYKNYFLVHGTDRDKFNRILLLSKDELLKSLNSSEQLLNLMLTITKEDIMEQLRKAIRDIPDFPIKGIIFRDISPLLSSSQLIEETQKALYADIINNLPEEEVDVIVGVESRGFLFGVPLAQMLGVSFVMARKPGKLPYKKITISYNLEYGNASVEMHEDSIFPGQAVIIHDDLLATGGTVLATADLVKRLGGVVVGCSFIIELEALKGAEKIKQTLGQDVKILSLLKY